MLIFGVSRLVKFKVLKKLDQKVSANPTKVVYFYNLHVTIEYNRKLDRGYHLKLRDSRVETFDKKFQWSKTMRKNNGKT